MRVPVVVDLRVVWLAFREKRGKAVTFLTPFSWFLAALGVFSSHLGLGSTVVVFWPFSRAVLVIPVEFSNRILVEGVM
jgi:nitrate reductase gamma subunit